MRILFLTPGSGDQFYCENCLRDKAVLTALRRAGHDALSVPLYLPLLMAATRPEKRTGVFFGGLNVFLQQKLAFFRRSPRWLDRLLDAGWLLRILARRAGATDAKDLGELTVSMLAGPDGRQGKELDRLVEFLSRTGRGDAIVLSNALLLGLAGRIRDRVGCPLLCLLQDEHELADALEEPFRQQAWALMREKIRGVSAVAASSRYYADRMAERLAIPRERIHVVYNGVDAGDYAPPAGPPDPPVIGYLTRMHKDFGLDLLARAFIRLHQSGRVGPVRLAVSGGQVGADKAFVRSVQRQLEQARLGDRVDWVSDFDSPGKRAFLARLSVLAVPGRTEAGGGLAVLEALAAGVPVVAPEAGVYPELIAATGGGMLFAPGDEAGLADKLAAMLAEPARAWRIAQAARQVVIHDYSADAAAGRLLAILEPLTRQGPAGR